MDLLFSYHQQKKDKHRKPEDNVAQCLIRLYIDNDNICYEGMFDFDYDRYGSKIHVTFEHTLSIDTVTGDVSTSYKISNTGLPKEKSYRNLTKKKKKTRGNPFRVLMGKVGKLLDHGIEKNDIVRYLAKLKFWNKETIERAVDIVRDYNKKKKSKEDKSSEKNVRESVSTDSLVNDAKEVAEGKDELSDAVKEQL